MGCCFGKESDKKKAEEAYTYIGKSQRYGSDTPEYFTVFDNCTEKFSERGNCTERPSERNTKRTENNAMMYWQNF